MTALEKFNEINGKIKLEEYFDTVLNIFEINNEQKIIYLIIIMKENSIFHTQKKIHIHSHIQLIF